MLLWHSYLIDERKASCYSWCCHCIIDLILLYISPSILDCSLCDYRDFRTVLQSIKIRFSWSKHCHFWRLSRFWNKAYIDIVKFMCLCVTYITYFYREYVISRTSTKNVLIISKFKKNRMNTEIIITANGKKNYYR